MANYPTTPLKLSTIDATLPASSEDASKIDDVLRQTRAIFKGLLALIMDDNGVLLAAPSIADGIVTTAKLAVLAVATGNLQDDAVTEAKIAVGAVGTTELADLAVTAAKIALATIDTAQLKDGSVTAAKLAALTITGAKISSSNSDNTLRAIGTDHIQNSAVIARCIADSIIPATKLLSGGASAPGRLYYDNGSSVQLLEIDSTNSQVLAAISGGKLVMSLNAVNPNAINTVLLKEIGTDGGTLVTTLSGGINITGWIQRPFKATAAQVIAGDASGDTSLSEIYDPNALVTFVIDSSSGANVTQIKFAQAGSYYCELSCAAYNASTSNRMVFAARLLKVTGGASTVLLETAPRVTTLGQDATVGAGIISVAANELVIIQQQCRFPTGSTPNASFGTPLGILSNEAFVTLFMQKVSQ